MIVSAQRLVTAGHDGPAWLEIAGGTVVARGTGTRDDGTHGDALGTVVPGFVDIHAHGALGHDFGSTDPEGRTLTSISLQTGSTKDAISWRP